MVNPRTPRIEISDDLKSLVLLSKELLLLTLILLELRNISNFQKLLNSSPSKMGKYMSIKDL
jgi:hypothetical protein